MNKVYEKNYTTNDKYIYDFALIHLYLELHFFLQNPFYLCFYFMLTIIS